MCPHEIVTQSNYESGIYEERAKRLLEFIEKDLGMQPPNITLDELFPKSGLYADKKDFYACWEPEDE
jgi:hypothetical protein